MIRLKELRLEKNLLQKDIAFFLHRTITCICDWERGRTEPNLEDLAKLADYFEVSVDYLLGRTDEVGFVQTETTLSPDEQELLKLYKQLSFRDKNQAIGFLKGLAY